MIKKKSNQEDRKIWEEYIKDPSDIYDKEQGTPYLLREESVIDLIYTGLLWMRQITK